MPPDSAAVSCQQSVYTKFSTGPNQGPAYFDQNSQEYSYPQGKIVTLRALRRWNGNDEALQQIFTGEGKVSSDCGYPFQLGTTYLVFANAAINSTHPPYADVCGRTKPISEAQEDIRLLDEKQTDK